MFSDNALLTVLVAPLVIVFEYLRPARKAPASAYRFDIGYWVANMLVLGLTTPLVSIAVAFGVRSLGLGLIDLRALGMGGVGGALFALLVSMLITDFFYYWFHRALHASKLLWQMHLLHHSDEHMNAMTANRGHFLEAALSPVFVTIPMAVLFKLPPVTIGLLSLIPYGYLFVAHANVRLGFGPLWWLLISPDFHRIHHSIERQHRDKNFANWFPVWDIVFGTVWRPRPGELPATGVEGVRVRTLKEAFLLPVTGWVLMLRRDREPLRSPAGKGDRESRQAPGAESARKPAIIGLEISRLIGLESSCSKPYVPFPSARRADLCGSRAE